MKPNQTVSRKTGLASKAERQTLQTTRKEESEPQCASLLGHIGTRKNVLVDLFVWPEKLQHAQHALSRKRYISFFFFLLPLTKSLFLCLESKNILILFALLAEH